jgi:hypothetical protein
MWTSEPSVNRSHQQSYVFVSGSNQNQISTLNIDSWGQISKKSTALRDRSATARGVSLCLKYKVKLSLCLTN